MTKVTFPLAKYVEYSITSVYVGGWEFHSLVCNTHTNYTHATTCVSLLA